MTTPDNYGERSEQIVSEMITRLRELQGSGEYPPLSRRISAGEGLTGGGTLENDITIGLEAEATQLLQALGERGDLTQLVTGAQLSEALDAYLRTEDVRDNVVYRDFTVADAPASTVVSPPLRVDADAVVERVTVSIAQPTTDDVRVTVRAATHSQAVVVDGGVESSTWPLAFAVNPGATISVEVESTSAAGIVVSLRVREV